MDEPRTPAVGIAGPNPEAAGAVGSVGGIGGTGATGADGAGGVSAVGGAGGVREEKGRRALGPVALVVAGMLSVQFGASIAVLLMPRTGAVGVVTLRLMLAALVLLVVCRPRIRGYARADWGTVLVFGAVLAAMNLLFYQAAARIPLGAAVTLEFLGPLALSVIVSRRLGNLLWAGLALGGVLLLSGGGFDRLDPVGVAYGLGAGVMWAAYIVYSGRTGSRFPQADGLALAMAFGALLSLPLGIVEAGSKLLVPSTIGLGLAVALMSSVLPYTLELLALRNLPAPTFAILMSAEPALAAMAGFFVLHQGLSMTDALAIALVIAASMGAVRTQGGKREVVVAEGGTRDGKAERAHGSGKGGNGGMRGTGGTSGKK
ncbi:EamA family transporter [Streptomyces sp. NBC_01498]|uniref:EamA family transporter n=1 Tax=Streptomyces sp. NBC_01498 TaxID=2975870 RepID=UPI002E7C2EF0|nr:EamA family transporter [Streptomyces sp. NBC_01498]WTL26243.1 EamA family transporter [Streptomyces sp. NBC_01498]